MARKNVADAAKAKAEKQKKIAIGLVVLLALAGFGGFWGTYGFVTWSNTLMIKGYGVKPTTAGAIVAVFAATAVIGKPLVGMIADRLGARGKCPR